MLSGPRMEKIAWLFALENLLYFKFQFISINYCLEKPACGGSSKSRWENLYGNLSLDD